MQRRGLERPPTRRLGTGRERWSRRRRALVAPSAAVGIFAAGAGERRRRLRSSHGGRRPDASGTGRGPVDRGGDGGRLRAAVLARRQPRVRRFPAASPARSPPRARTTTAGSTAWATSASGSSASTRSCGPRSTTRCRLQRGPRGRSRSSSSTASGSRRRSSTTTGNAYDAGRHGGVPRRDRGRRRRRPRRRRRCPSAPAMRAASYRTDVSRWLLALLDRHRVGPERGRVDRPAERRQEPVSRGATSAPPQDATPMESWLASMLDYTADARRQAGLEPAADVHELAHARPARPPRGAARAGGPRLGRRHPRRGDRGVAGRLLRQLPRISVLPGLHAAHARATSTTSARATARSTRTPATCNELRAYHGDQAVAITEFGVPSSLGVAHIGPIGRDQGNHSEQEALRMNADMLRDIQEEGFAGRHPLRVGRRVVQVHVEHGRPRAAARSASAVAQRPHQRGVLRRGRGRARRASRSVVLDGRDDEWEDERQPGDRRVATAPVREVRAVKDEQYLYLRLRLDRARVVAREPDHDRSRRPAGLEPRPAGPPGRVPGGGRRAGRRARGRGAPPGGLVGADADPLRPRPRLHRRRPADMKRGQRRLGAPASDPQPRRYFVPTTGETRPAELHELEQLPIGTGDPDADGLRRAHARRGPGRSSRCGCPGRCSASPTRRARCSSWSTRAGADDDRRAPDPRRDRRRATIRS